VGFPGAGSLLLQLDPVLEQHIQSPAPLTFRDGAPRWVTQRLLDDPVPVTLSEPNVLLLDRAGYRLNDEAWQPEEEVLRIDNLLRTPLGLPLKMDAVAQPWTEPGAAAPSDLLSLRFTILCDVEIERPLLALEDAERITIWLDGAPMPSTVTGWYVDEAIKVVPLPMLRSGSHEITLRMPYGRMTNLEWCYLLGDFGVATRGRYARVVVPVRELAFGDWTTQGLPFYAGNVTYHCTADGFDQEMAIHVPSFNAPLVAVSLDGSRVGTIAFAPYRAELGYVSGGSHRLDLTVYGNRIDAFGPVHNADAHWTWFGPNAWRTQGDQWSYEYQLKPMGILAAPQLQGRQPAR
jgi:hypothetical protein